MKNMRLLYYCFVITLGIFSSFFINHVNNACAGVEWEELKALSLDEKPLDVAVSLDGTRAYILGNKQVLIYSTEKGTITDKIPLKDDFTQIAVSPDGELLYLTDTKGNKISFLQVATIYKIDIGDSPVIGKKAAPVKVVAFLDYQCPYCAQFYPMLQQLIDKYPKQACLVIKNFPLRSHRFAEKAALACLAAARQKKFRELSDIYFKNFSKLTDETIRSYAQEAGLNMSVFDEDRDDEKLKKIISDDISLGRQVGIRGVPAVYINGRVVKNRSLDALAKMVEQELKKQKR